MNIERALRIMAGTLVIASVMLGILVNPHFLWFTLFVGVNLLQSGFTNWCPAIPVLRKAGLPPCQGRAGGRRETAGVASDATQGHLATESSHSS